MCVAGTRRNLWSKAEARHRIRPGYRGDDTAASQPAAVLPHMWVFADTPAGDPWSNEQSIGPLVHDDESRV